MNPYPKRILTIPQQLQSYTDAGMTISSVEEATAALTTIGYYRLRGYSSHLYDNASRQYRPGTDFSDILNLYHFDTELSRLLFGMATCIEVALRARLSDALLTYKCPSGPFPRPLKISRPEKAAPILFWPGIIATVLLVGNW